MEGGIFGSPSNQKRGKERTVMPVVDYMKSNVSEKVLRIIISYTDYIKRNIWKKKI